LSLGEHEVRLSTDGKSITITASNLLSGNDFEIMLNTASIAELVPAGFSEETTSVVGFYGFLQDAYGQEAGTAVLDVGAELVCASCEVAIGKQRPTVVLKPDAVHDVVQQEKVISNCGSLGWFAVFKGRWGQAACCKKTRVGYTCHSSSDSYRPPDVVSYILRWVDDGTQSDWIAFDQLRSIVGSRDALTKQTAVQMTFTTDIVIPTPGRYTSDLQVQLRLHALTSQIPAEAKQSIQLRSLRREMDGKLQAQRAEANVAIAALQEQVQALMRREQARDTCRA
jgi:hypothetical protein